MELIYQYTRKEAIEDGVLVDVTEMAKEAGIRYPTALTCAVWEKYVRVPEAVPWQDEKGRLWDILWMFHHAAMKEGGSELLFQLVVNNDGAEEPKLTTLKAICGPGDDPEPTITVMLPEED